MVMIDRPPYRFMMDGYLKDNMDIILKEAIPNEWDALFILFGKEGSGKSTLASQLAIYTDPTYNIKRCVFTAKQFEDAIDNAKEEQAIVWDEAIYGAKATQHANSISEAIVNKLTVIREKKLKIYVCFPYLYMLNKYFVTRCMATIYIYAKGFDDRGYLKFYNNEKIEYLYNLMKRKYIYNWVMAIKKVNPSFYCKYPKEFCLPRTEYLGKKRTSSMIITKPKKVENLWRLVSHVYKKNWLNQKQIAEIIGYTPQHVGQKIQGKL